MLVLRVCLCSCLVLFVLVAVFASCVVCLFVLFVVCVALFVFTMFFLSFLVCGCVMSSFGCSVLLLCVLFILLFLLLPLFCCVCNGLVFLVCLRGCVFVQDKLHGLFLCVCCVCFLFGSCFNCCLMVHCMCVVCCLCLF